MLYDCILEVSYSNPTPFINFSNDFVNLEIEYWCNTEMDILIMENITPTNETLLNALNRHFKHVQILSSDEVSKLLVVKSCLCHLDPLDPILEKNGCLDIPPIKFSHGKEYHRILFDSNNTDQLLEKIRKIPEINRIKIMKLAPARIKKHLYPLYLSIEDLYTKLSSKQLQVLINAYKEGYYEIPRKTKAEILANDLSIHRRTFEEHLRKGENSIMSFIIPLLQIKGRKVV